jgi:hypothetical protein
LKKVLVVLAAGFATAAIAATPAFAGGTTWDGNGVAQGETCTEGAHWILSPGDGIASATLTVEGVSYAMEKHGQPDGNGSLTAVSTGPVDLNTDASAAWDGPDGAFLKVSDCFGSSSTTGGTTTGTTGTTGETTGTTGETTGTTGETTGTTGETTGTTGTTGGGTTGATSGSGGISGSTTGGTTGGTAATPTGGNLPFTGLPVWIPLLAAAAMLASGIFLVQRKKGELS